MSSKRYEIEYDNGPGKEPTLLYVQEVNRPKGTAYVLTEHPENQGPHVSQVASKFGDAKIKEQVEADPKYRPESFRMYAERPERGRDNEPRFAEFSAKTTQQENISTEPNRFEHRASEWMWKDGNRWEKPEAERIVGAEIETSPQRFQDKPTQDQNQEFREASLSGNRQTNELRTAAQEQEARQKHQR